MLKSQTPGPDYAILRSIRPSHTESRNYSSDLVENPCQDPSCLAVSR